MNANTSRATPLAPLAVGQPVSRGYKVDVSRGERIGRVSSEWFSRPNDERYLSLPDLYAAVRSRADRAAVQTIESRAIRVEASRDDAERLTPILPGRETPVAPPPLELRPALQPGRRAAWLSARASGAFGRINLQHGLLSHRAELVKTLETDDGRVELRAVTSPDYGRIGDHELVAAVMNIAGDCQ